MSKLLAEILKQKRERQAAEQVEHELRLQAWIANCESLMAKITEWLEPLVNENYLEIRSELRPIWEEQFGEYEIPALRLVFSTRQILVLRPIGHFVIGTQGRVDITSVGITLAMLIHKGNAEWAFAKREQGHRRPITWPFNRATFEEFLVAFLEE